MSRRRVDPQPESEKSPRSSMRGRRAVKADKVATITVERPHGLAVLSHSDRRLLAIVLGVSIAIAAASWKWFESPILRAFRKGGKALEYKS